MESRTKAWLGVVIIAIAVLLATYGYIALTGNMIKENQIEVGGLFHLTGPGSFWGNGELNGAQMAVEEINSNGGVNGRNLRLIIEDGRTDFTMTANAINKLVNVDEVDLIIGPTWFGQLASPMAEELKVLVISPSAGTVPQPSDYFFDVWPTERQEIKTIVQKMEEDGINKTVIVYNLNDWSESMKDNFIDESGSKNIEIVNAFPIANGEQDFRTILIKIRESNAEAIYAPFAWYPDQGTFSKQMKELGLEIPIYSSSGTENPILLETFPEIEGTIYPYPAITSNEEGFRKRYEEKFGLPASPSSAYAYDATYILAEALENTNGSPEDISDYLRQIKYQGVSNHIEFDGEGRVVEKEHVIKMVRNGEFVTTN